MNAAPPPTRTLVVTGVPIDCVGVPEVGDPPFGTELSARALRAAGLTDAVGAVDSGDLDVRIVGRVRDARTGVVGWPSVVSVTRSVRDWIRDQVAGERVPLVLGGCCTLVPGALAGARDALGTVGLAYLDGHLDLYDGRTSPTGEPADMPISVIVGHGPQEWVREVGGPLVAADHLALLGPRDRAEATDLGSALPEQLGLATEMNPSSLRDSGMAAAGRAAQERLAATAERYWVHLDVDVLDEQVFPATDYLMPSGLSLDELRDLMRPLTVHSGMVGLSVACYNPDKDHDGSGARALVHLLADVLRRPS